MCPYRLSKQQSSRENGDDNIVQAGKVADHELVNGSAKCVRRKKNKSNNVNAKTIEIVSNEDEVEKAVREVNKLLGENNVPKPSHSAYIRHDTSGIWKNILVVQYKHLNVNNEVHRLFGSDALQKCNDPNRKRVSHTSSRSHKNIFNFQERWGKIETPGISMVLLENVNGLKYFTFEHDRDYKKVQNEFLAAVESFSPSMIQNIIYRHPYHIDCLLQLSDAYKQQDNFIVAAELVEKALYCLENAFHPGFTIDRGNCRLDYRRQVNRAFYVASFKHVIFIGNKACYRTSLELSKFLLSLDPDDDPLAIILMIDYYALCAGEYKWLIEFLDKWKFKNELELPNMLYSLALAHFLNGDKTKADQLLQKAIITFPGVLVLLLEFSYAKIDMVSKHPFFVDRRNWQPDSLNTIINLFARRNYHIWKNRTVLNWMESNVVVILPLTEKLSFKMLMEENSLLASYRIPLPRNILRHIYLSEIEEVTVAIDTTTSFMSFDPLPPDDSINLYNGPRRPNLYETLSNLELGNNQMMFEPGPDDRTYYLVINYN
ncbi:transcription factor 25-like [Aethina tumida]|uniref:transcription factor 25-like n=1 Tax=Aethina tumida TaxID=116153 RepID=UPI00214936BD|nr:transcription factor 25-like [Aethina tumida]